MRNLFFSFFLLFEIIIKYPLLKTSGYKIEEVLKLTRAEKCVNVVVKNLKKEKNLKKKKITIIKRARALKDAC